MTSERELLTNIYKHANKERTATNREIYPYTWKHYHKMTTPPESIKGDAVALNKWKKRTAEKRKQLWSLQFNHFWYGGTNE